MFNDRNDTHILGSLVPVIQILTIRVFFLISIWTLLLDPTGIRTSVFLLSLQLTTTENKISSKRKHFQIVFWKKNPVFEIAKHEAFLWFFSFVLMFLCISFLTGFSQNHCGKKKKKKAGFVGVSEMESQSDYAINQKRQTTLMGLKCWFLDQNGFRKEKHLDFYLNQAMWGSPITC